MDKYEFNIKVEQIKKLVSKKDFATAMKIADTIDWRRVRNANLLSMISQVYEKNREYQEAKEVLLLAFERAPIGKRLLYKLTELALKEGSVAEAEDYYREFCDLAPDDTRQYILRYMLLKEQKAPMDQLIHALERYTSTELDEKWMYELAELYARAGRIGDCVQLCDKMILLFGVGTYVERAMELKQRYAPLNHYQQDLAQNRDKYEEKLRAVEEEYENGMAGMGIYEEQDNSGIGNQEYMYDGAGGNVSGTPGYVQPGYGYMPEGGNYAQPEGGYMAGAGSYAQPAGGYVSGPGSYVQPEGGYISGSGNYEQPGNGYTAEPGNYVQPGGGYVAGAGNYVQPGGGYAVGTGGYVQPGNGYAAETGGYVQPENGYAAGAGDYVQPENGYIAGAGGYIQPGNGYAAGAGGYVQPENGYAAGAGNYVQPEDGYGYAERTGNYGQSGSGYVPGQDHYSQLENDYAPEGGYVPGNENYSQPGAYGTGNYSQFQDNYMAGNDRYVRPAAGGGYYGGTGRGYDDTEGQYMEENGSYGSAADGSYAEDESYYSDNSHMYQRNNFVDEELVASLHQAAAEQELAAEMSKISAEDYVEQEPQSGQTKVFRQRASNKIAEAVARRAAEKEKESQYHDRVYTPHHLMIEAKSPETGFETAIEVLKGIHQKTGVNNQVIKISGSKLSNRGVFNVSDKLAGKDLIVEEAGDLRQEDLEELQMLLERDETGMIVVLIDNPYQMEELHHQNPGFINLFKCINADQEDSEPEVTQEENYLQEEEAGEEPVSEDTVSGEEPAKDSEEEPREEREDGTLEAYTETAADATDDMNFEEEPADEEELVREEQYSPEAEEDDGDEYEPDEEYSEEDDGEYEDRYEAEYETEYEDNAEAEYEDEYEGEYEEAYDAEYVGEDGYNDEYEDGYAEDEYAEEQEYSEEQEAENEYDRPIDDEELDLNDFADYAVKYASEIDCSITGKSMLALYERIEIMEEDGIPLTRTNAEDLIEEAADKAEKPSLGGLIKGVFSSKYDKDGLLILKEEHFI